MKIILDHCVDRRLAEVITGHVVETAADRGLQQLKNGGLIVAAAGHGFEVLITIDRNLRFQQNLAKLPLTILELCSPDARLASLVRLIPAVATALDLASGWRFVSVRADGGIETLAKREE